MALPLGSSGRGLTHTEERNSSKHTPLPTSTWLSTQGKIIPCSGSPPLPTSSFSGHLPICAVFTRVLCPGFPRAPFKLFSQTLLIVPLHFTYLKKIYFIIVAIITVIIVGVCVCVCRLGNAHTCIGYTRDGSTGSCKLMLCVLGTKLWLFTGASSALLKMLSHLFRASKALLKDKEEARL